MGTDDYGLSSLSPHGIKEIAAMPTGLAKLTTR